MMQVETGVIKTMSDKWLWIIWRLVIMLSAFVLSVCRSDKVLVGCSDGCIYSSDVGADLNNLRFDKIMELDHSPKGIAHVPATGKLLITEYSTRILRANPDGTQIQTVIDLTDQTPHGICVVNGMLFWTDKRGLIYRVSLDGSDITVIINATNGYGITCDSSGSPSGSFIYWVNFGGTSIQKAALDGSSIYTVTHIPELLWDGLTIDDTGRFLYVASKEQTSGRIVEYNLDTQMQTVSSTDIFNEGEYIRDIAILNDKLIFVERDNGPKVILKSGGQPLPINITGLENNCTNFISIHVMPEIMLPSTSRSLTTAEDQTTGTPTTDTTSQTSTTTETHTTAETSAPDTTSQTSTTAEDQTTVTSTPYTTTETSTTTETHTTIETSTPYATSQILTRTEAHTTKETPTPDTTYQVSTTTEEQTTTETSTPYATSQASITAEDQTTEKSTSDNISPQKPLITPVTIQITPNEPSTGYYEWKDRFERKAELFQNQNAGADDILQDWDTSIFPEFEGNLTRIQTRYIDTEIFEVDRLIDSSWVIEVASDNDAYDFKIMYPDDAWGNFTEGYRFVTSVLDLPLHSKPPIKVDNKRFTFASRVLSITMFNSNNQIVSYTTGKRFSITFGQLQNMNGTGQATCQYLKPFKKWSPNGCNIIDSDGSQVTCSCNHMTSFAVLMQLVEVPIPIAHQKALSYVTYIAISASVLCLVATIILFVICKLYKIIRIAIHINLAVSLLLAQLLFVTGVTAKAKVACIAVTVMLHYLWLVVFMWMLMEGIHLYLKVNPNITLRMKLSLCMPLAWGIPAGIAFLTLGISKGAGLSEYVKSGRCWLTVDDGLIFAFAVPAVLITVVNFIFLVIIIHTFVKLKTNQDKSEMQRIKASVRAVAILMPLLGITWVFGVLQFDQTSAIVFSYLFNIGNGLQGVFVFITQCLLDDDVKAYLKQKTSRGRVDDSDSTAATNSTGVTNAQ
ncbi:uncharacterized protein [Amphiura filiformis]|uniref:uncharacterized protein n=1 Tax=Amphiura filiformis TaxID=82378 RepID=UPI003B222C9A